MNDEKKIFITGGHLSPAIAVIEEMKKKFPAWHLIFLGRTIAMESDVSASSEYEEIQKREVRFLPVTTGRMRRDISLEALTSYGKIPLGFLQSLWYCLTQRPDLILSFGGYVSLPVACAGWLLGIPVITHEQTHRLGFANSLIALFSDVLFLSYEDTKGVYLKEKTVVTGLPIRKEFFFPPKISSFSVSSGKPILYITGGTTVAVTLNEIIFPVISRLVKKYIVIHQTGKKSFPAAKNIKENIPINLRASYLPYEYLNAQDVSWIMHHMALVVGRSGANTVAEVSLLSKNAVFIPLPWSGKGEQKENALYYAQSGRAEVLNQKDLTTEKLYASILRQTKALSENKTGKLSLNEDAAERLTDIIVRALRQ